ncbi:MAG: DUF11 domain-containing protein, partial [Caldilinea sp.]|nr:DUF11 domain-containing protein [Caldilinea sp.]
IATFYYSPAEVPARQYCPTMDAYRWDGTWDNGLANFGQQCDASPHAVSVRGLDSFGAFALKSTLPVIALQKSVSAAALYVGDAITYTIAFSNSGGPALGAVITDIIPAGVTNVGVNSSGIVITDTAAEPAYVWDVGYLGRGTTGVITVTGIVDAVPSGGVLTNAATIVLDGDGEPATASDQAASTVCAPNPTVTSAGDSGAGTLRQALNDACAGDTVGFNLTYPATITLTSGQPLTLTKAVTISGPGADKLAVS